MKEKVSKKFGELYGSGAILFASPGRINLIGEHTDYNGGFVFPGAVDKGIVAAIKLNGTLSGEHGIGTAKAKWMEKETSRGTILFSQRMRRALDPKGLLNPTKLVGI